MQMRPMHLLAALTLIGGGSVGFAQDAEGRAKPLLRLEPTGNWRLRGGPATALTFDASGRFLASGGSLGDVRLWDWKKRRLLQYYPGPVSSTGQTSVRDLRFSPNGKQLAVLGRKLRVMAPGSGRVLFVSKQGCSGLAYDSTGDRLAMTVYRGVCLVLDSKTWKVLHRFDREPRRALGSLCFDPKDKAVYTSTDKGHVWRLDLESGEETLVQQLGSAAVGLAFSEDGRLISASRRGLLRIGKEIRGRHHEAIQTAGKARAAPARCRVYTMDFDRKRGLVALRGYSTTVSLWDREGKSQGVLSLEPNETPRTSGTTTFAFGPEGEILVATRDGLIRIHDKGKVTTFDCKHDSAISSVAFTRDSQSLAVSAVRSLVVDLVTKTVRRRNIRGGLFGGPGLQEIGLVLQKEVQILDSRTLDLLRSLPLDGPRLQRPKRYSLSPDGRQLAIGGSSTTMPMILNLENGKATHFARYWGTSIALLWRSDSKAFLHSRVRGSHGERKSLDLVSTDGTHKKIKERAYYRSLSISPDSRHILAAAYKNIELLDAKSYDKSNEESDRAEAPLLWLRYIDKDLALAHDGQSLSLWDTKNLQKLQTLPQGGITHAHISPDKQYLALTHGPTLHIFRLHR